MRRAVRGPGSVGGPFLLLAALLLPAPAVAGAGGGDGARAADGADDERSVVLLQRECSSDLSRRELTLFANGTVRLREEGEREGSAGVGREVGVEPAGGPEMYLGELSPDELETYVRLLQGEDLGESGAGGGGGPEGPWVEECRLTVHYDRMARWVGPPPQRDADAGDWVPEGTLTFRYGRFDSLSLSLAHLGALADRIAARVDRAAGRHTLPPGYRPQPGDVLRRVDGVHFRVERRTAEGNGWELQGVEQPLTLYVNESDVPELFDTLVAP